MGKIDRAILDEINAKLAPAIGATLHEMAGEKLGFVLFTFKFGGPGEDAAFISNADRDDLKAAVKELLEQLDDAVIVPLPRVDPKS